MPSLLFQAKNKLGSPKITALFFNRAGLDKHDIVVCNGYIQKNGGELEFLSGVAEFNWDKGNRNKDWTKHKVSDIECEEVFFNIPLVAFPDKTHSKSEDRHYLLGKTNENRLLFIVFTMRGSKIRIISARDMKKKERRYYHEV